MQHAVDFIKAAKFSEQLLNNQWNQFAICLSEGRKMVGDVGIHLQDRKAEIGFTLDPAFQKRGLAITAVTAIIEYIFGNQLVDLIVANTDPSNTASIRLLEKLGFAQARQTKFEYTLCFYL